MVNSHILCPPTYVLLVLVDPKGCALLPGNVRPLAVENSREYALNLTVGHSQQIIGDVSLCNTRYFGPIEPVGSIIGYHPSGTSECDHPLILTCFK